MEIQTKIIYKIKYRSSKELEIYLMTLIHSKQAASILQPSYASELESFFNEDDRLMLDWFENRKAWPLQYQEIALAAAEVFPHN